MDTIDLSRLTRDKYAYLIERWKSTAKTPYKGGSSHEENLHFDAGTENDLIVEFHLFPRDKTLEFVLWGTEAGRRVDWSIPIGEVPSDPSMAYARFVLRAAERDALGFARRHKGLFMQEWEHFVDLFPDLKR
jgi:hypothetical protein